MGIPQIYGCKIFSINSTRNFISMSPDDFDFEGSLRITAILACSPHSRPGSDHDSFSPSGISPQMQLFHKEKGTMFQAKKKMMKHCDFSPSSGPQELYGWLSANYLSSLSLTNSFLKQKFLKMKQDEVSQLFSKLYSPLGGKEVIISTQILFLRSSLLSFLSRVSPVSAFPR